MHGRCTTLLAWWHSPINSQHICCHLSSPRMTTPVLTVIMVVNWLILLLIFISSIFQILCDFVHMYVLLNFSQPVTKNTFRMYRVLGKGGFGEVCACQVRIIVNRWNITSTKHGVKCSKFVQNFMHGIILMQCPVIYGMVCFVFAKFSLRKTL